MDCSRIAVTLKISGITILMLLQFSALSAQTWSEFFQQKKMQKRYLIEQLAALKVYAGYLEKGYKIVGEGTALVRDFKNGEFGFHDLFFRSLKTVSPVISRNPRLLSMLTMQEEVFRISVRNYANDRFGQSDMAFIEAVKNDLKTSIVENLESLSAILETGKLEMSEDERMTSFNRLYEKVHGDYLSATSFDSSVRLLLAQKNQAAKELKKMEEQK